MKNLGIPGPARAVLLTAAFWLTITWILIIAVDFLNLFELQSWTLAQDWQLPFLWWEIYREARFTENLQWLALGSASLIAWLMYRELGQRSDRTLALAWLILCSTLCLMLIEDSLNFRHVMADWHLPAVLGIERLTCLQRMAWEAGFYMLLSTGMITPVLLLWKKSVISLLDRSALLLMSAYLAYGLVGFGSALRKLGDWQSTLGTLLIDQMNLYSQPAWSTALTRMEHWRETVAGYEHTLGFLLVDHLLEESVEFLAASLLLATVFTLRARTRQLTLWTHSEVRT